MSNRHTGNDSQQNLDGLQYQAVRRQKHLQFLNVANDSSNRTPDSMTLIRPNFFGYKYLISSKNQ